MMINSFKNKFEELYNKKTDKSFVLKVGSNPSLFLNLYLLVNDKDFIQFCSNRENFKHFFMTTFYGSTPMTIRKEFRKKLSEFGFSKLNPNSNSVSIQAMAYLLGRIVYTIFFEKFQGLQSFLHFCKNLVKLKKLCKTNKKNFILNNSQITFSLEHSNNVNISRKTYRIVPGGSLKVSKKLFMATSTQNITWLKLKNGLAPNLIQNLDAVVLGITINKAKNLAIPISST